MKTLRTFIVRIQCASALLLFSALATGAQPYVPASDSKVLARVPAALLEDSTLRDLRAAHRKTPTDLGVATRLAWRYVGLARRTGAQRYLGYAEAALANWWAEENPPPGVAMLRASVAQSRHEFDRALDDLAHVLTSDPRNANAWTMLSTVQKVTGRPVNALNSCRPLRRLSTPLMHAACHANAASMTEGAGRAYDALSVVLRQSSGTDSSERQWAAWVLAGLASELRMHGAADRHYEDALAIAPPELNLSIAYADHLLATDRPRAALDLVGGLEHKAPAVLRKAIALERLGDPEASSARAWLRTHFADLRLRGDPGQSGDEARFELYVLNRPQRALELATHNAGIHRESRDIELLLDAAIRAHAPRAVREVLTWLATVGYSSPALELRRERLSAMSSQEARIDRSLPRRRLVALLAKANV